MYTAVVGLYLLATASAEHLKLGHGRYQRLQTASQSSATPTAIVEDAFSAAEPNARRALLDPLSVVEGVLDLVAKAVPTTVPTLTNLVAATPSSTVTLDLLEKGILAFVDKLESSTSTSATKILAVTPTSTASPGLLEEGILDFVEKLVPSASTGAMNLLAASPTTTATTNFLEEGILELVSQLVPTTFPSVTNFVAATPTYPALSALLDPLSKNLIAMEDLLVDLVPSGVRQAVDLLVSKSTSTMTLPSSVARPKSSIITYVKAQASQAPGMKVVTSAAPNSAVAASHSLVRPVPTPSPLDLAAQLLVVELSSTETQTATVFVASPTSLAVLSVKQSTNSIVISPTSLAVPSVKQSTNSTVIGPEDTSLLPAVSSTTTSADRTAATAHAATITHSAVASIAGSSSNGLLSTVTETVHIETVIKYTYTIYQAAPTGTV